MQVHRTASHSASTTSLIASLGNVERWAVAPLHENSHVNLQLHVVATDPLRSWSRTVHTHSYIITPALTYYRKYRHLRARGFVLSAGMAKCPTFCRAPHVSFLLCIAAAAYQSMTAEGSWGLGFRDVRVPIHCIVALAVL